MSQPPQEQRMPLDAIIPCKYLFKVTTEFPQFVPPYRWWEDESTTVLWAFQKEARLVIRYALLRNQNLLRSMLLSRNPEAIDTIINLIKPDEQQYNTHLSHESKVKKILDQSCLPPFNPIPWPCFPQSDQSLDAQAIAQSIETQSHFQLRTIAFEDIVRASLGYPATSVEWFLRVHTELYVRLLAHLQIHTEEIPVYEEVEKLLQTQSPFAHRAVLQSLVDLGLVNAPGLPQPPMHSFDFIARPIQILFQYRPYSLTEILKICELFAFRFKRDYINAATVPWKKPFDSTFSFLEECFISSSASDLARTLTDMDKGDFANLSQQSIMAQDTIVTDFLDNWNALTVSVWEVLCAIPDLAPYLQECAQKLFHLRNYHSATAVLYGLREYDESSARFDNLDSTVGEVPITDSSVPPNIRFLIDDNQNYTAYREYYLEYPGIPFLRPHLRGGESALQPVFKALQNQSRSVTTHKATCRSSVFG